VRAIVHDDDALSKKPQEDLRLGIDAVAISVAQATEQIRSQVPGDELTRGYSALLFRLIRVQAAHLRARTARLDVA
jgi:hypothetical protein